jgi:hypothetical protein
MICAAVGPMKMDPLLSHSFANGARSVESVARMNGVALRGQGRLQDGVHVQVGIRGARRTDADCAVGEPRRQRVAIRLRSRQHSLDAQHPAGTDDARGDLSPVGDQHPADLRGVSF